MKKVLIIIITILLCVIAYSTIVNGFKIGQIEVLGISGIQEQSQKLDKTIEEAEKLNSVTYLDKMNGLNVASKDLIKSKKTYEELIAYSEESDIEKATQTQKYDIQFLMARVGIYTKRNGVKMKMDVIESSIDSEKKSNICYLKFTVTGSYISIGEFIADIEKDAKLSFTIENFTLTPGTDNKTLQATFRVNNIAINSDTITTINGETASSPTPTPKK